MHISNDVLFHYPLDGAKLNEPKLCMSYIQNVDFFFQSGPCLILFETVEVDSYTLFVCLLTPKKVVLNFYNTVVLCEQQCLIIDTQTRNRLTAVRNSGDL